MRNFMISVGYVFFLLVAGLWLTYMTGYARAHHPVYAAPLIKAPTIKLFGGTVGGSGGSASLAVVPVVFIGGVAAVTIWCGLNQPKRNLRRDTWVDGRHDVYPVHNPRKTGCIVRGKQRDPNVVSVRG